MLLTLDEVIKRIEKDNNYYLSQREVVELQNLLQVYCNHSYWKALQITPVPTLRALRHFEIGVYSEGFINKGCARNFRKVKYCHECIHFLECLDQGESIIVDRKGDKKR